MYWLYSALLALALLVTFPYWLIQMLRHGKYRSGLRERLGRVPDRLMKNDPRPVIWIHAVSVGEVLAITKLVDHLQRLLASHRIVVSTTTAAGQNLARKPFGEENVFYFPLDFTLAI